MHQYDVQKLALQIYSMLHGLRYNNFIIFEYSDMYLRGFGYGCRTHP